MTTAIKTRPIIFTGESVRAILDGRKTQTRRVVKPQPEAPPDGWKSTRITLRSWDHCPFGVPGDRLWVREAWAKDMAMDNGIRYYATDDVHPLRKKRSPIYMRKSDSRITLEVVAVRVERVQEISEADAIAEGCMPSQQECQSAQHGWLGTGPVAQQKYRNLWDSLNAKRGYSWESNPWVIVVEFKRLEQP